MTKQERAILKRFNAHDSEILYRCRWSQADADEVVPQLIDLLDSTDPLIQHEALRALFTIGTPGAPAADRVAELTRSADEMAKRLAVLALGQIAYTMPDVCVEPVAETLSDPACCRDALRILAYIGPAASGAIDRVKPLFSNADAKVRKDAVKAAANMSPTDPEVLNLLHQATNDRSKIVREAASKCLRGLSDYS